MPRIRSIKPEFCTSEAIAALSIPAELHFAKLWTYCDDDGRGADNPRLIKAAIWPLRDEISVAQVEELQTELASKGRIIRYEDHGKRYFQVVNFPEHQKPQHPKASEIPPPPDSDTPHEASTASHEASPETAPVVVVGEGDVEGVGEVAARGAVQTFDAFWENYPTRNGIKGSKRNARNAWRTLKPQELNQAVAALPVYAAAADGFPKDAERYLRGRLWEGLDASQVGIRAGPRDRFAEAGRSLQQRVDRVKEEGRNGQLSQERDQARRGLPAG